MRTPNLICPDCGGKHDMMAVRADKNGGDPLWWCPSGHEDNGPYRWDDTLEPGYSVGEMEA